MLEQNMYYVLVAKKLGRERAGQLSGIASRDGQSVEREELPSSSTSCTPPDKTTAHLVPHKPNTTKTGIPTRAVWPSATYFQLGQPRGWDQSGTANPQTPFDDLVSVTSRMLDEETLARNPPNKQSRLDPDDWQMNQLALSHGNVEFLMTQIVEYLMLL